MIRIYCQQTIGGYKIFNISAFTHQDGEYTYVFLNEIAEALKEKTQSLVVTNSCHNGLDSSIIHQFSSGAASMLIVKGCGSVRNETTLFVSPEDSTLKFAFVTDDSDGLKLFAKMATMWISETGRKKLSDKLINLVAEPIIDDKMTFAFNSANWKSLIQSLSEVSISSHLKSVAEGEKGFLVYNTLQKKKILMDSGINKPLSYFIAIPGNEELRKAERNRRLVYLGITVGCCIAAASIAYSMISNGN